MRYITYMDSSSSTTKGQNMLTNGARAIVTVFSSGRTEKYNCTIVELRGVAYARVQIDGDRIINVFQSQLKAA